MSKQILSNIIPVIVYRSVKPEGLRIKLADPGLCSAFLIILHGL